jgi:hypothetical protein
LKNNKSVSRGDNTWTGKLKKLKDMDLREAEINAFDSETAAGMRQVADISNASIIKQIKLDETDWAEMLADQRTMIVDLQRRATEAEEKQRILYRENLDLKKYCAECGIDIHGHSNVEPLLKGVVVDDE